MYKHDTSTMINSITNDAYNNVWLTTQHTVSETKLLLTYTEFMLSYLMYELIQLKRYVIECNTTINDVKWHRDAK